MFLKITRDAVLLLAISPFLVKAQERAYLDTTQVQIHHRQREPATGSGGIIGTAKEGQTSPPEPLALTVKILGKTELAHGETFEYEVQIRNISSQLVEMPWDLSEADIEPTDPDASYQYQTAAISLDAKLPHENRTVSLQASVLLFGRPSISSTMVKLEPRQWVRIKGRGRAMPSNPNDTWPPFHLVSKDVEGTLEGTLMLSISSFIPTRGGNSHEDMKLTAEPISSNRIPIQFRF